MAKEHLAIGPFGAAACGKRNVNTTQELDEVTCEACKQTAEFTDPEPEPEDG